ncbi:MAG: hypothetical protein AB7M93_23495, partial [Candidatus Obscuribacterales bacterium]
MRAFLPVSEDSQDFLIGYLRAGTGHLAEDDELLVAGIFHEHPRFVLLPIIFTFIWETLSRGRREKRGKLSLGGGERTRETLSRGRREKRGKPSLLREERKTRETLSPGGGEKNAGNSLSLGRREKRGKLSLSLGRREKRGKL